MLDWPCKLYPRGFGFSPDAPWLAGPRPIAGAAQRVVSGAGGWRASMDLDLHNDRIELFRAFAVALLSGGASAFMLRAFEPNRSPLWASDAPEVFVALREGVPHDDGATFDDGSVYVSDKTGLFRVAAAAARGATSLRVSSHCGVPFKHCFFGLGTGDYRRLYYPGSIVPDDATALEAITYATVSIWPPLRAAAAEGDGIEIEHPACPVLMTTPPAVKLDHGRVGRVSLDFEEIPW